MSLRAETEDLLTRTLAISMAPPTLLLPTPLVHLVSYRLKYKIYFLGLSRVKDGLCVAECDLNLCRQVKDSWGLRMTARYEMYAELLTQYIEPDFQPQIVKDPSLQ